MHVQCMCMYVCMYAFGSHDYHRDLICACVYVYMYVCPKDGHVCECPYSMTCPPVLAWKDAPVHACHMYVRMYLWTHACMSYVCTYVRMCLRIHACTRMHTAACASQHTRTRRYIHTNSVVVQTCCAYIHTQTYTHVHMQFFSLICEYANIIYILTYIHTHTQAPCCLAPQGHLNRLCNACMSVMHVCLYVCMSKNGLEP